MVDVSDSPVVSEEPQVPLTAPVPTKIIFPPADKPSMPTIRVYATEDDMARAADLPKLAVEVWAERKGYLPQLFAAPVARAGTFPVAQRANPKFWMFAAARAGSGWPIGAEVTEAEFDAAVETATTGISR